MNKEKQQIAIAEACGWREIHWVDLESPRVARERKHYCPTNDTFLCGWLPDYLNDLNAMHEAEGLVLCPDDTLLCDYVAQLRMVNCRSAITTGNTFNLIYSTAAQRAEAFLKTIGKWRD